MKKCIDEDIAATPVLEAYARDHGPLLERCREKFRDREASGAKLCVDKAIDTEKARGTK